MRVVRRNSDVERSVPQFCEVGKWCCLIEGWLDELECAGVYVSGGVSGIGLIVSRKNTKINIKVIMQLLHHQKQLCNYKHNQEHSGHHVNL